MAFEQVGVSPDEWGFMKSMMPEYMKDNWFLLMPWRDDRGRLNVMNMTNLIPGLQQVSDFMNKSPVDAAISSPVYSLVGAMKSKTKFSGAPLYYEWEKPTVKAAKTFGYVWESLMPSWFPGGYDWNKISDAMNDRVDAPCVEETLLSTFGLRTRPIDPGQLAQRQVAIKRIHLSELQGQLRRDLRNSSSPDETQKIIERYTEAKQDISTLV